MYSREIKFYARLWKAIENCKKGKQGRALHVKDESWEWEKWVWIWCRETVKAGGNVREWRWVTWRQDVKGEKRLLFLRSVATKDVQETRHQRMCGGLWMWEKCSGMGGRMRSKDMKGHVREGFLDGAKMRTVYVKEKGEGKGKMSIERWGPDDIINISTNFLSWNMLNCLENSFQRLGNSLGLLQHNMSIMGLFCEHE